MAERASVFQGIQIGPEVTHGTAVAASKQLTSLDIQPAVDLNVDLFRPQGNKYVTVAAAGKDLTTSRMTGKATYTEMLYVLAGLFGAPVITGPNSDGAYTWTFSPASTGPDAFVTYTIERGSSVAAERFTHGLFASLGMTFDRDQVNLSGTMLGQAQATGITLTATPTGLPLVPILGKQIDVYVDAAPADLGTTKFGRLLRGEWNFGDKYSPLWVVDSSQASFVSVVEKAPNATFKTLVEANAAGTAFLATARAGDTRFIRIHAGGPLIAGSSSYGLTIDMAVKMGKPDAYADEADVYALPLNWSLVHDADWNKALTIVATTTLAGL